MAAEVMPHERNVRAWLARARLSREDVDEVIQDCYCRFAMLATVDHIARADAYFFSAARNLMLRRLSRAKIVPFEALSEADAETLADDTPSPERQAAARIEMARLRTYLAALPERCRQVIELRKFEGLSQKEIAARLGVTEHIVENDIRKGMAEVQRAWRAATAEAEDRLGAEGGRERRA